MATEVALPDGTRAKIREPALVLLWTFVTLGVYNWVWYYKINRELRDYGASQGDDDLASTKPLVSLLAVTLGGLLIVPPFVSWWKSTRRIEKAQGLAGVPPISFGLIIGCMFGGIIFSLVWLAIPLLVQEELNKIWKGLPEASGEKGTVEGMLPARGDVKLPGGAG